MAIQARMFVTSFEKSPDGSALVKLSAVTSRENARWAAYTPDAQFSIRLTRKASGARTQFERAVDAAIAGGKGAAECLITLEFDNLPPLEQPGRAQDAEGKDVGYASDET